MVAVQEQNTRFVDKYDLDPQALKTRRDFIRLGEEDAARLSAKVDWINTVAGDIAREFYDWQFQFPQTLEFFNQIVTEKGGTLAELRQALEAAQKQYLIQVFEGASCDWDGNYYERRLRVGAIHAKINLPLKWYLGSYSEFLSLLRKRLSTDFPRAKDNDLIVASVEKVFWYDAQAICDAFLFEIFEEMGLSLHALPERSGYDKTDSISQLKQDVHTLQQQAQAIAEGRLGDPVLQQKVPGPFGESFLQMTERLVSMIRQITQASEALAAASTQLSASSEQMSAAIQEIAHNAENAAQLSNSSSDNATETRGIVDRLGDSSTEIGGVVEVIKSITDQTKVLALNASIEAARAGGDAGKGFAVVAHEVKELSKATAEAAEDISQKIHTIQKDTNQTVSGIKGIGENITDISEVCNSISTSIEQQTLATENTVQASSELSRMAEELKSFVGFFSMDPEQ